MQQVRELCCQEERKHERRETGCDLSERERERESENLPSGSKVQI